MNHSPAHESATVSLEGDDYLTTAEAASLLKVHEDTIRKAITEGRIPHIELGPKTFRIPRAGLRDAWNADSVRSGDPVSGTDDDRGAE